MRLYAGGTLSPREHYYVERPEDKVLYKLCKEGEYCYILAARQLGKSSLAANGISRLQKDGIRSLYIDLQGIGREIIEREKRLEAESYYGLPNPQLALAYKDKWYLSLLNSLLNECKDIREDVNLEAWWASKSGLDHVQKMTTFFSEVLLARIPQQMIVFIDEIDRFPESVLSDDFFMALRKMHNDRFNNPELERLSFVIIGLRLPRHLIQDKSISPFNIGTRIDLADFQIENAMILTRDMKLGLELSPFQVLKAIFKYTNGHPYMTHEACKFLTDITCEEDEEERYYLNTIEQVDELMEYLIKKTFEDKHLGRIRDWITSLPDQINVLRLYGYILDGNEVVFDETIQPLDDLRYSGLIRTANGIAKVRNQVYEKSLDRDWVVYRLRQNVAIDPNDFSLGLEKLGIRTPKDIKGRSEERKSINNDPFNLSDLFSPSSSSESLSSVDTEGSEVEEFSEDEPLTELSDDQLTERLNGLPGNTEQKQERIGKVKKVAVEQLEQASANDTEAAVDTDEPDDLFVHKDRRAILRFFDEVRKSLPWISPRRRNRIILVFIGILFSFRAIFWLLDASSDYSLILRGSVIALALVLISTFVTIRKKRSLVEERLGRFLEDDREPEAQRDRAEDIAAEWRNRGAKRYSIREYIARELTRANLKITVIEYIFLVFLSTLAFALIIYIIQPWLASAMLGAMIGLLIPRFYLKRKQKVRAQSLDNQLPDLLNLMVTGLRSGYSTMQAMEAVSRNLDEPISEEFRRVVQEMQIGIPMETALQNMLRRVPSMSLDFVITAINIQRETGGNLAEILNNIRSRIWERKQLTAEAQKLSVLSFDFFYPSSVCIAIIQNFFFPGSLNLAPSPRFAENPIFLLLIIWSLILLVGSAIRLRKHQLLVEFGDRTGYQFVLYIILLFIAFLTGVPPFVCVWLAVILFSRSLLGLIVSSFLWLFVLVTYLFSIDILSFTIRPDRMEMMQVAFEWVGRFLAGFQPTWSIPSIRLPSISAFSGLVSLLIFTLIIAIAIIIYYSRGDDEIEDDPLQARLAEFIQRGDVASLEEIELSQSFAMRLIGPFFKSLGEFSLHFAPQGVVEDIERKLELAGSPWPINAPTFLASRFIIAVFLSGSLLAFIFVSPPSNPSNNFIYLLATFFIGYFLPSWVLTLRIRNRQTEIRRSLPDTLDLLTICVDAGLGLDAAMSKVSEKWDNELSLIFVRAIREVQLGKVRRDALRDMADRAGVPELRLFVAAAMQSDQLGVSISRVLRSQGYELDVRLRDGILRELTWLDVISKISFFLLFGMVFVFWLFWPLLGQLLFP